MRYYTKGEPREALIVRAIADDGQWILPRRNGDELPSKPPLFHWLGAAVATARDHVDETATRLPSWLAGLLAMTVTAVAVWRSAGAAAAAVAVAALATSGQWIAATTVARVDMTLAAAVTVATTAIFDCARAGSVAMPYRFYWASAAAVLAKGPVGVALPAAVLLVYAFASGSRDLLRTLRWRRALAAICVPVLWYAAATVEGGQAFVDKLLVQENVLRVLDAEGGATGHVRPFYWHVPLLVVGFAPWSLFLPWMIADALRSPRDLDERGGLFPAVWLAVTLVLFSAAGSKRAIYLLPAYPALAWWFACWWNGAAAGATARSVVLAAVGVLLVVPGSVLAAGALGYDLLSLFTPLLSERDAANAAVVAGTLAGASGRVGAVAATLLATAAAVIAAAVGRRHHTGLAMATLGILATVYGGASFVLPELAERQTAAPLGAEIQARVPADATLSFYRGVDYGAVFYAGRPIERIDDLTETVAAGDAWLLLRSDDLDEASGQAADAGRRLAEVARNSEAVGPWAALVLVEVIFDDLEK